jgi:hypothetical protein
MTEVLRRKTAVGWQGGGQDAISALSWVTEKHRSLLPFSSPPESAQVSLPLLCHDRIPGICICSAMEEARLASFWDPGRVLIIDDLNTLS